MRGQLVRLTFVFIGWVLTLALRTAGMLFMLMITSVTSLFVGVPTAIERIADSWIEEATNAGLSMGYHQSLRTASTVVAYITLILGWLILASLTVFIIRLITS